MTIGVTCGRCYVVCGIHSIYLSKIQRFLNFETYLTSDQIVDLSMSSASSSACTKHSVIVMGVHQHHPLLSLPHAFSFCLCVHPPAPNIFYEYLNACSIPGLASSLLFFGACTEINPSQTAIKKKQTLAQIVCDR